MDWGGLRRQTAICFRKINGAVIGPNTATQDCTKSLFVGLHRSPGRFLRRASRQAGVERITHSATGHSVNQESAPSRISFPATDSPVHGLSVIASAGDVHVSAYTRVVREDHSHSHAGADLRTSDALHESLRRVTVVGRFFQRRSGPISRLRTKNNASRA
jgi:hypothetical protein